MSEPIVVDGWTIEYQEDAGWIARNENGAQSWIQDATELFSESDSVPLAVIDKLRQLEASDVK